LDGFEIVELPIEMTGKEQDGIFQLAFAIIQGPFSKTQNGDCSADNNGCDQQTATKHKPTHRIPPNRCRNVMRPDRRGPGHS
jgi:hypothetical protein